MTTARTLIALEASGLSRPRPTGVGTYGRELARALATRDAFEYVLVTPWWRARPPVGLPGGLPDLERRAYASGGFLDRRVSLLHSLDTRIPRAYRGPLVATLFDVLSLLAASAEAGWSPPRFRERKARAYREIARRADAIVVLSESVRRDVDRLLSPRGRIVVVPPGVREAPRACGLPARALEAALIRKPYVLAVGALCPRKNLEGVARAFVAARSARPGLRLVVAGEPAFGWEGSAGEEALGRLGDAAVVTGYLPPDVLWGAMRGADAILHLSHYEGFGLTVLEALAAGVPVVAADRGGTPEAAGEAAWLVDPDEPDAAGVALVQILEGRRQVGERVERGIAFAASRTWTESARRIETIYREVLGA